MQKKIFTIGITVVMLYSLQVKAQYAKQDTSYKKFFIGSSLFMIANLIPDNNSPDFVQLNLGYRLSHVDAVTLELKTWKYGWPLGIPYGDLYESPAEKFPGYIREYGFAFAYQHFWWKGLYTEINVMNAFQTFVDEGGKDIGKGFQLFNTYRVGYHIKLFKDRFFIQPSLTVTHRPFHTNMPESFKQVDSKWSKFFFGEPGLHVGANF